MATILFSDDFESAIEDTDIVILEIDKDDNIVGHTLADDDPIKTLLNSKCKFALIGRQYTLLTDKNIAIWACRRRQKIKNNVDPMMYLLHCLKQVLDSDDNTAKLGMNQLITTYPNDFSGTITICGAISDSDKDYISKIFDDWCGTIVLVDRQ